MKTFKRLTVRQGIMRDTAMELAAIFPHCSEAAYRQNIGMYIGKHVLSTHRRSAYYTSLSELGKERLWNSIARESVIYDKRYNPQFPMLVYGKR